MSMKKKLVALLLSITVGASTFLAATQSAPSYINELYAAISVQANADIIDKISCLVNSNELYKAKLAEYVAVLKGKSAGISKTSDLYAQALAISETQENPAATALLKKRYEQCIEDEKYDGLSPSAAGVVASDIPDHVHLLYKAVSIQSNASYWAAIKSWFVSNNIYKAKLSEYAAITQGRLKDGIRPSNLYAQALLLADINNNPSAAKGLKKRYEKGVEIEKTDDSEQLKIATLKHASENSKYLYYGISGIATTSVALLAIAMCTGAYMAAAVAHR